MYFKRILAVIVSVLLFVSMTGIHTAEASTETISVKLSNYIGKKTELSFSIVGEHSIKEDLKNEVTLEDNKKYKIKAVNGKLTLYRSDGTKLKEFDTSITVEAKVYSTASIHTIYGNETRKYLGDVSYAVEDAKYVRPTNRNIPFEDYLKSVVPHEMPASWDLEALKAQAVTARTYSIHKQGKTVDDTQAFQVYGGYDWHPNSTKALEETKGQILKYNGYSIGLNAVYSSSNGGYTEAASNLWGNAVAYLPAKKDTSDPVHTWTVSYNKDQINTRKLDLAKPSSWWATTAESTPSVTNGIKNWLYKQTGYENTEIKITRLADIAFTDKNSSGRSQNATFTVEFFVKDKATNTFRMENGKIKTFSVTGKITANAMRTLLGASNMKSTLVTRNEIIEHPRLGGIDRFDVAVNVSKTGWTSAATVVLANWDAYGDALAATPLAYKHNAPILLTKSETLNTRTKAEIERLKARNVIIVGGPISVSENIVGELENMGISVRRISGKNRVEVANNIARDIGSSSKVVIADGFNFPDALSIAPYAARNGYPILLTDTKHLLQSSTQSIIDSWNISQTIISGGPLSVSDTVYNNVPNPVRFGGNSRFDVSAKIANTYFKNGSKAFITKGFVFADALTGSVLAAKENAPILLVQPDRLTTPIANSIEINGFDDFTILGGPISVNDSLAMNLPNLSVKLSGAGYGHGVGMSQYGASQMAKDGNNYKDILSFYYPGTTLSN